MTPLFELKNIIVEYPLQSKNICAINDISLKSLSPRMLVVGESGCGKSTLAKTLVYLQKPKSGKVLFKGKDLSEYSHKEMRRLRKEMQIIFQDPDSSLNPRMTAYEHLKIALETHNLLHPKEEKKQIQELLELVHLPASFCTRYPFELSGGQKQRLSLARALSVEPEFLVLDEPLASLDASIRGQMIELLQDLRRKKNLSYFFITHDIATMKKLADHVAVLYLGSLVELADLHSLSQPLHPYTQALFSAAPVPNPHEEKKRTRIVLPGDPPSLLNPPKGCPFHTRCPHAKDICRQVAPKLQAQKPGHFVSCHLY